MTNFISWNDFINFSGSYHEKLHLLKSSQLVLTNPSSFRQIVWVGLIDPTFASLVLNEYKIFKSRQDLQIPEKTLEQIHLSCVGSFGSLKDKTLGKRVEKILFYFLLKRKDIPFTSGMQYIAGFLLGVFCNEADAFVMFCHFIENIYPSNFWIQAESKLGFRIELQIFAMSVERFCPKIAKALTAVFKPRDKNERQFDYAPFEIVMMKIAEKWYLKCFTQSFAPNVVMRMWDIILIYGFECFPKIALLILSEYESEFIHAIKLETRKVSKEISVDSLIISGIRSIKKLFELSKYPKIENLLSKVLKKPIFTQFKREDYFSDSERVQKKNSYRLIRLRQTRNILQSLGFTGEIIKKIYTDLDSQGLDFVNLSNFSSTCLRCTNWNQNTILNVFNSIDENRNESIQINFLGLSLSLLLHTDIEQRLSIYVDLFPPQELTKIEFLSIISRIEEFLDPYSETFSKDLENSLNDTWIEFSNPVLTISIPQLLTTIPIFRPLIEYLKTIDTNNETIPELRIADIGLNGSYSNIHSPLYQGSEKSEINDEDMDDLEKKLNEICRSEDGEVVEKEFVMNKVVSKSEGSSMNENEISTKFANMIQGNRENKFSVDLSYMDKVLKDRNCGRLCTNNACKLF
ncbi:hypothetical protein SteCoe_29460 [Stentor coeruleus]|uniref:Rab-GAP TBC domain-containing protein n=1 Tax=Stentor coeruleus TaxID=5963 RepID=A0A1R2B5Y7_9CILI|nr:hypothetical protein SteCoe_29460 [Stentor coeruleus]